MPSASVTELSARIKASVESGSVVSDTLATSQRIIARVTDGIYREPWAAFRELVANAYDADATRVIIETGAPDFAQVSVRDDGNGMSADTLAYVVKNIGGSSKRTKAGAELHTTKESDSEQSPAGRPLIGKIGIGLFAVAQLTQHFQIVTKAAGEHVRTSATIKLRTHDEAHVREPADGDEKYVAGTVEFVTERVADDEIDNHGTAVVLYSLRPEIQRSLQSLDRWVATKEIGEDGRPVQDAPLFHVGVLPGNVSKLAAGVSAKLPWAPSDSPGKRFAKLFQAAEASSGKSTKRANLDHFDEYLRLIWQLSLSLPLAYVERHPFSFDGQSPIIFFGLPVGGRQATRLQLGASESLRDHLNMRSGGADPAGSFTVLVDGVELRRPIELLETLRAPSRLPAPVIMAANVGPVFKGSELERAGGQLRFEAYLYWNSRIIPKDTAGVLIRVREASGTLFDPDFLKYQVSEQTRLRQITAEIFVTDGLDAAINIDRESFNYSHPHFIYIQKWLHGALRLLVNRLKFIADQDLARARADERLETERTLLSSAVGVWTKRRGESSDLPLSSRQDLSRLVDVAGTELQLPDTHSSDAKALAIAVVLESYGVLGNLSSEDRTQLIADLLAVLDGAQ